MNRFTFSLIVFSALGLRAQSDFFIKELVFPADADSVTKIEMASRLVPSPKQLAWQDLELTAFLHFGVNTFTDREWGDGTESPSIFNPANLDADQWVKVLKDAGFKMVILTAKHHDGFCLWPTATTSHSVASSPWRNGEGDVMREISEACRRHGMKLGVYLSPWDRNAECYGDSPRYNDMFVAQLTELLTNYGKVDEVWFDGACGEGPNGKKQEYDWPRFKETMERLQPDAVLAIMGDDVRWVGNEKGQGRETEWSATALTPGIYPSANESNSRLGLFAKAPDLGGRDIVAKADRLYWWPSEVDVSIRPGWFWHEKESPKSLRQLAEIYLNSVGRNSVLLLNIPPDRNGLIDAKDARRLAELRQWIDANFSDNLNTASVQGPRLVNCVVLQEDISKGQRIERFTVNADGKPVAEGTTVGKKRIILFDPVEAEKVDVVIESSRGTSHLLPVETYFVTLPAEESADDVNRLSNLDIKVVNPKSKKSLTIDLGVPTSFSGFTYTPRPDVDGGLVFKYRLAVSDDGKHWQDVPSTGEFSNIVNNPIEQIVRFPAPVKARYFKLIPSEVVDTPSLGTLKISFLK